MNPRERALAILLIGVIILGGGGFFGYQFVYVPWNARSRQLANLKKEEKDKRERLEAIARDKPKLERWKEMSLPGNLDVARVEYEKYLNELLDKNKIVTGREVNPLKADTSKTAPTTADKQPIYTRMTYKIHAYATMPTLLGMLEDFYKTGLMHEIKTFSLQRQITTATPGGGQTRADELELTMTVEALVVTGADKRPYLLPNFLSGLMAYDLTCSLFKTGLTPTALWAWTSPGLYSPGLLAERSYGAIARKNVFLGRPPKEESGDGTPLWMTPRFTRLTDITQGTLRMEATLYDVSTNTKYKLNGSYNNDFPFVRDGKEASRVVRGFIVKVEERELIYRAEFAASDDSSSRAHIVKLSKADREQLVASNVIGTEEADGVVRIDRDYWDMLVRANIVRTRDKTSFDVQIAREPAASTPAAPAFGGFGGAGAGAGGRGAAAAAAGGPAGRGAVVPAIAAPDDGGFGDFGGFGDGGSSGLEVLKGKVLFQDDTHVYIRPEVPYYTLHLGESIEESLKKKPLPPAKVKELKDVTSK